MSTSALNEAIYQNTAGNSDGSPVGLWWDVDASSTPKTLAPSGWTGVTAWGQVYQQAGASVSPTNATDTVQIQNFTTYLHLTNGTWVKVQDQTQSGIGGAHYLADFSGGDASTPMTLQKLADGSLSMDAPPSGYNDHFWPGLRGTFTAGAVDGIFVEAEMKTNDPNANLLAQIGADWWRSSSAQYAGLNVNNTAAGLNDWVKLTTQWQPIYYTSFTAAQLTANPPPGLEPDTAPVITQPTTPTNVAPTVTQASASPGTGTEHVGDTVILTLGFSEAVTVTGTPTLSLNDGAKATYVGGSGTSSLNFKTTVASTDTNTSALAITGVNLPSSTSIKDSGGLAANLAGAVKTFSGLQISTTSTTTTSPTIPTTPTTTSSVTKPVLSVADSSLWVAGRGGTVDLGTKVTTTDSNDRVTVNITGLPKYETITDRLDGQTYRGNNLTLTAAQVDSGLTLQSNYKGNAYPVATLTLTATGTDPTTGAVASAAPQTITVTDPRPTTTTTSPQSTTATTPASTQPHLSRDTGIFAATAPQPIAVTEHPVATAAGASVLANRGFALLEQHMDSATSTLATTSPQPILMDPHFATGTETVSLASQSFALLNQYLAGNTGRVDPGQIVAAVSQTTGFGAEALLARPVH